VSDLVSIVIPAHNQLAFSRECIYSIKANTEHPYKLILVDNGSTDGTRRFFESVPDATVVHSDDNKGFAGGVNLGLAHAEGHVLLLNNDTIVPRGWLGRLVRALRSDDGIGMVGPMSNCVSGPQQINNLSLKNMDAINAQAEALYAREGDKLVPTLRLVGFCLLIRDSVFSQVGLFDESYKTGNFEDDDYCLQVNRLGYRLAIACGSFVFHYGSRTFNALGITDQAWDDLLERNREIFQQKWQVNPLVRKHPAVYSRELNDRARDALRDGTLDEAIDLLHQAIDAYPPLAVNYNDLGAVFYTAGDYDAAFQAFTQALEHRAGYEHARENLLDLARVTGREQEAQRIISGLKSKERGREEP